MRILYIAFDNPAVDTILGGMNEETLSGLPAFFYPFKLLLERGNTIDLLLFSNAEHEVTESEHFKKENFFQIKSKHGGALGKLELPLLLMRETRKRLKIRHYDFVYGCRRALTWAGASVVIFEPTLKSDEFEGIPVVADLDEFKRRSDLIVANRMEPCLSDSADKVYTRDLYFRD